MRKPHLNKILVLALSAASVAVAFGQTRQLVYTSDFNTTATYNLGPINGQNGWYSTSGNNPGPGAIEPLNLQGNNSATFNQKNSFVLGGDAVDTITPNYSTYPTAQVTTIYNTANTGNNSVSIRTMFDLAINNPPPASFEFNVFSTTGYDLMNILLSPVSVAPTTANPLNPFGIGYALGIQSQAGNNNNPIQNLYDQKGSQLLVLPNTFYDAAFNITGIGTDNQAISMYTYQSNSTSYYGTTTIQNSDFSLNPSSGPNTGIYNDGNTTVGYVGISWITPDDNNGIVPITDFGDNSIVVQNLTLTSAVPEPSQVAASLLLIAGVAGFMLIRRLVVTA